MKEFVMRGQTASTAGQNTHIINFSGHKGNYGFRLVEFQIYPSTNIPGQSVELTASITADKFDGSGTPADPYVTPADPENPDFDQEGLIGNALYKASEDIRYGAGFIHTVINNTFMITQDIILSVKDLGGGATPVNWQCKFMPVKLSSTEAALTNYRQFSIFDE